MCCDRSPAAFSQRYNFPSEQAWQQYPLYVVVALAIRRDFARYAPPCGQMRMSKRSKPRCLTPHFSGSFPYHTKAQALAHSPK